MTPQRLCHSGTGRPELVQSMSELAQGETGDKALPVPLALPGPRPSLAFSAPSAAFVSQLIAARAHLAPQRPRRIGTAEGAVGAYGQAARLGERRMPQGYRKTVVA
jgi:hypothetical protein